MQILFIADLHFALLKFLTMTIRKILFGKTAACFMSALLTAQLSAYAEAGNNMDSETIRLDANAISAKSGSPAKETLKIKSEKIPAWIFDSKGENSVAGTLPAMPTGCRGVKVEIVVAPLSTPKSAATEDVYRATIFQKSKDSGEPVNKLKCVPARSKVPAAPLSLKTIELESCYPAKPGLPITVEVERLNRDPSDTFDAAAALLEIKLTPVKDRPTPFVVENSKGYNSWPMMQALGDKLVCVYSRGQAHTIHEGARGAYVRTSSDGGKTWSEEKVLSNVPDYGEVPIGKGLDENGEMLVWIRFVGKDRMHKLYKTKDGVNFTHISTPTLNPMPMQITDVFHVPTVGLMAIWFTGNYGKDALNAWGTLVSKDNGKTWTQKTVESGLKNIDWNTEQSAVYLGNGKILAIARVEHSSDSTNRAQFQLESTDYGNTWTRQRTNIGDIFISTPSLIYDKKTGLVSNYYYQRARGMLKRRVVEANKVFGNPLAWPNPEIVAFASAIGYDAGNVNATQIGDTHYLAYYSGDSKNASILVSAAKAPSPQGEKK